MYILLNPILDASRIRCSIRETGLISPDKPVSPEKQISLPIGISRFEERTELIIARSIAGSFTLMPPAILRKTSFTPNLKPALFSSTARSMFSLLISKPVELLCGVPYTALLTSACASIRNGLSPSTVAAIEIPLRASSC